MPLNAGAEPHFSRPEPPYKAAVWQACSDALPPPWGAALAPFSRELPTASK
jgi:hypothetical protein